MSDGCGGHAVRVRASVPVRAALRAVAPAIASAAILVLGGCASPSGIAPSARPIQPAAIGLVDRAGVDFALRADWWKALGDPTLDALVERALADAPRLKVAKARFDRALSASAGARSAEGPKVDAAADLTRQRYSANTIYPPPVGGGVFTLSNAQINASYAFDFFSRNRAAIDAAVGAERAARADIEAARLVLASSVARTYVQLGRLFEQREVASRSLGQRTDILSLIEQRVRAGLDSNVELRLGEGALPDLRRQIEQIDEAISHARHALAALTAQPPAALERLVVSLHSVQVITVPDFLPVDMLGRRADITAARWRVEAAASDVKGARAAFYPNVSLSAFVGLAAIGLDRLVHAGSERYGVGPALTLPIFDAARLRANLRGKTADLDAAIETYNAAIIDAVRDAADQISSLRSIERQQAEQASAQASAESAFDLARQRYRAGLANYLIVLNAEAGVLDQRRLAADLKARAIDVRIALIDALGGGYVENPSPPAAANGSGSDIDASARISRHPGERS